MPATRVRRARHQQRIQQVVGRRIRAAPEAKALPESDRLVPKLTMAAKGAWAASRVVAVENARMPSAAKTTVFRTLMMSS